MRNFTDKQAMAWKMMEHSGPALDRQRFIPQTSCIVDTNSWIGISYIDYMPAFLNGMADFSTRQGYVYTVQKSMSIYTANASPIYQQARNFAHGAATWRTGRNIRVDDVFYDAGPLVLHENMTSSQKTGST